MVRPVAIPIPNALGGTPTDGERLLHTVLSGLPVGGPLSLDLAQVRWVCPYGALLLLHLCAVLATHTGAPICLIGIDPEVHKYLRRIDFFDVTSCVYTTDPLDDTNIWSRRSASSNVLELTCITSSSDVIAVVERIRQILETWFDPTVADISRIVSLVSESCANIVDHSSSAGWITMQKYEHWTEGFVDIELAIGDPGQGIRASLSATHGALAQHTIGYITAALGGRSARGKTAEGMGLRAIRDIALASGGHLFIRSEEGALFTSVYTTTPMEYLAYLPGTQLAIRFRSHF